MSECPLHEDMAAVADCAAAVARGVFFSLMEGQAFLPK